MDIRKTQKNNEAVTQVCVKKPQDNISPAFCLEPFYKDYENGEELEDVLRNLAEIITNHQVDDQFSFNENSVTDWELVRAKVVPKLVPIKGNTEYLADKVYTKFAGDLAIIYQIPVIDVGASIGAVTITEDIFEHMKGCPCVKVLDEVARANIVRDSVYGTMFQFFTGQLRGDRGYDTEELGAAIEAMRESGEAMNILSNTKMINGAAQILNPDVMKTIADKLGDGFWILPSSIHEVIIVPAEMGDAATFTQMVKEVNAAEVAPQDVLSDHVYRYLNGEVIAA